MKKGTKEKRFLDALEALFTGAEVEGDSGFVNLMRMKRIHFKSIQPELMKKIDQRAEKDSAFREELFDKLYTFFNRYFCESGSIYFRHLPAFSKIYERVYADGQDVALSWKTQMLYYVKSDVLVRSMPIELTEEGKSQNTKHFYFDASRVEHKKNNERREFIFSFSGVKSKNNGGGVIIMEVSYSERGRKTNTDDILKQSRKASIRLSDEQLQKAIRIFQRQTEADFFINKDAKGFLREQFDLWVYQYIFHEETIFEEKRIRQIQAIKNTAYDIIDFIAQFEDELRRVWEKPKFVRNVNYVVTLDKLTDATLKKIMKHINAKAQVKEWRELGVVDDKFSMQTIFKGQKSIDDKNGANSECRFLPLDTKHFKDLELEILDCLGNLDEALDGELVHSENWQALNTLQKRYKEKVKCIYIDPPYNTGNDEFIYRDTYRHSSWLTMLQNRIDASHDLLVNEGINFISIDDNEQHRLRMIMDGVFGEKNSLPQIIVQTNPRGRSLRRDIAQTHEYVSVYGKDSEVSEILKIRKTEQALSEYNKTDENGSYRLLRLRNTGIQSFNRKTRPNLFFPIYVNPRNGNISLVPDADFPVEVLPLNNDGIEGCWTWSKEKINNNPSLVVAHKVRGNKWRIYRKDYLMGESFLTRTKSLLTDKDVNHEIGKEALTNLFRQSPFEHPKSPALMAILIKLVCIQKDFVLDYFAGSGTTAHAVINLNREDGGNRKYLLIEMGDYFHTVLLPRIKKVVYSKDWKDGKPASREGSSHFLKYYTLEQYEETLKNSRYEDGEQLELDTAKSPFEQYAFFADDKLAHFVKPLKNGKIEINLHDLYPDIDIAESLSNIIGKQIRKRTADTVTFEDGSTEKTNPKTMTEKEKMHFISLIKSYLWWGE